MKFTVIPLYCDPTTAPTLQNAYSPISSTSVGSTTSFTCLPGYISSSPSSQPFLTCSTNGQWSGITFSCQREPDDFFDCIRFFIVSSAFIKITRV